MSGKLVDCHVPRFSGIGRPHLLQLPAARPVRAVYWLCAADERCYGKGSFCHLIVYMWVVSQWLKDEGRRRCLLQMQR